MTSLLIDQNIPPRVADELSAHGFQVHHVSRLDMGQADDYEIIRYALHHGMAIVTQDLGMAIKMPRHHFGLILIRKIPIPRIAYAIASTLQDLHSRGLSLEDAFVTIEPGRYRVRSA